MSDLIKTTQQLPDKPTAADTADWYRLGDAVEKHGRHMKRQAVAAEYNSGRNMEAWYRELQVPEETGRMFVKECRRVGLIGVATPTDEVSKALPTQMAAREYAKAEPEVRERIKEIIKEDPEAEIKAAEIKKLRAQIESLNAEQQKLATEAIEGRIAANDRDKLREQLNALTVDTSVKELESARKEADALLNTIQTLDRQIKNLSTKVFTHNDPYFIEQIGEAIERLASDYTYKSNQVVSWSPESSSDYSSGTTGGEVRVLDVTHTY